MDIVEVCMRARKYDWARPRGLRGLVPPVHTGVTRATCDAVSVASLQRPAQVSLPASPRIIYRGLDVHKDSVAIAVLPADATAM